MRNRNGSNTTTHIQNPTTTSLHADLLDTNPRTIAECKASNEWEDWKRAIQSELDSLKKREVFEGPIELPPGAKTVGSRWVFVKKVNSEGQTVRYKARLVAQGYSQRPGFDYTATYSPVMDFTTYRLLIAFSKFMKFDMDSLDIVTAYLYGELDREIYINIPEGYNIDPQHAHLRSPCLKITKALYGLKQSGRQWYHKYASALIDDGYTASIINPCVFYRHSDIGRVITSIYVDDSNVFGDKMAKDQAKTDIARSFETKDLGRLKGCIGLQVEQLNGGVLVHQSNYTRKLLESHRMTDCNLRITPLEIRNESNDVYGPRADDEPKLEAKYPYSSAIGSLSYLANTTRPDIAFSVNLLARFTHDPTARHWQGVKAILRYLKGTLDYGLYYQGRSVNLTAYSDAGYQSDMTSGKSQTGFVVMVDGTAFSWRSVKQSIVTTSTAHAELVALYETSREVYWVRQFMKEILDGLKVNSNPRPTVIYEDNEATIRQIQSGYIRSDYTKHISPKYFYTVELVRSDEIVVEPIASNENIADIFTKTLPPTKFIYLRSKLGLVSLSEITSK